MASNSTVTTASDSPVVDTDSVLAERRLYTWVRLGRDSPAGEALAGPGSTVHGPVSYTGRALSFTSGCSHTCLSDPMTTRRYTLLEVDPEPDNQAPARRRPHRKGRPGVRVEAASHRDIGDPYLGRFTPARPGRRVEAGRRRQVRRSAVDRGVDPGVDGRGKTLWRCCFPGVGQLIGATRGLGRVGAYWCARQRGGSSASRVRPAGATRVISSGRCPAATGPRGCSSRRTRRPGRAGRWCR